MQADQRERMARLHILNTLFPLLTGNDLYLAREIERAINFSATGDPEVCGAEEDFNDALVQLLEKYLSRDHRFGFFHWDAFSGQRPFDPLWAREEIIAGLKQIAGFPRALFLGTGLRKAIQGNRKKWNAGLDAEYEEAVEYMRRLAVHWTTGSSNLTLIIM